jgi:hypothetical protein
MFFDSKYCVIYIRVNRSYELTPFYKKIERLNKIKDRLIRDMIEAGVKLFYFRQ